jgi:O-antigen ligase
MKRQVCLVALALLQAYWWMQPAEPFFKLLITVFVIGAALAPAYGAIGFAAVAPMSTLAASWLGGQGLGADMLVQIAFAIGAGVVAKQGADANRTRIGPPALVIAIIAVASAAAMIPAAAAPVEYTRALHDGLTLPSARASQVWAPVIVALIAMACAVLGWAIERLARQSPALVSRLVLAGLLGHAASAAMSVKAVLGAAMRSGDVMEALPRLLLSVRLSLQTDWNAAASAFLLAGIAGFGLARRRGPSRVALVLLLMLVGMGLWITGSRVAIVLAILATIGTLGWLGVRASRHRRALIAAVAIVIVAVGGWFLVRYPEGRNDKVGDTLRGRWVLMQAGLRMAEDAPVFGIGVDRFYEASTRYASPIERSVPVPLPENAHNNFIQVLAEQGLAGLMALLWLLWTVFGSVVQAQRQRPSAISAALLLAMTTCVATWLTGHPLLSPEFAFVFWLYAGMLTSLAPTPSGDRSRRLAWIALAILVISVPVRAVALRNSANLEYRGLGVSMWQHDDVQRYRNAGASFSLFLSASDRPIELPLRRAPGAPDPITVSVHVDDKLINRVIVSGDTWRTVQITVPRGSRQFEQVDFSLDVPADSAATEVLLRVGKEQAR